MDTSFIQDDFTHFTVDLSSDDITMQESQPVITTELLQPPPSNSTTNNNIIENINENTTTIDNPLDTTHHLTFNKSEFSFLPTIHDIVNKILTGDNSEDIGKAVIRLNERIEHARRILQDLPGLQYVKEEQEDILKRELSILEEKKNQIDKYSSLMAFDK
ncbi:unnamed protein product [Cunninghamella echinulata]